MLSTSHGLAQAVDCGRPAGVRDSDWAGLKLLRALGLPSGPSQVWARPEVKMSPTHSLAGQGGHLAWLRRQHTRGADGAGHGGVGEPHSQPVRDAQGCGPGAAPGPAHHPDERQAPGRHGRVLRRGAGRRPRAARAPSGSRACACAASARRRISS